MLSITKAHAKEAITKYENLRRRVAGMREEAAKVTKHAIRTATVGGTAFGIGLIQGRSDGVEVFGVPIELVVGGGATLFALADSSGDYSHHLAAIGDGAIAAYLTTLGRGVGVTMRQKAIAAAGGGGQLPAGGTPVSKGVRLTPDEVAEMANSNG